MRKQSRETPTARSYAIVLLILLAAGVSGPLSAQSSAFLISLHGGRYSPLVNLTDEGGDFSAAFSYGASLGVQLGERTAIRGTATRHRAHLRGDTFAVADSMTTQYSLGLDLQIGWPATGSLVPYVFAGGGWYSVVFDDPTVATAGSLSGRFGVGMNRVGGLGAWFLEIGAVLYEFRGTEFQRMQFGLEVKLGYAVAIGL